MHLRALPLVAAVACASACAARPHTSKDEGRDHPLAGRYWDVRAAGWVDESKVAAAAAGADFLFLGETHDNPQHHRLQARMLQAAIAAGRRPAVAFEMLDVDQQPQIDASTASAPGDPDALADAVGWAKSGWPPFSFYRPVFATALDAGLPIVATNLSRRRAREVASRGSAALDPGVKAMLERAGPLPEEVARELREEMAESHCGQMPESMLDPLVLMQRARDAEIASRVLAAGAERGAVLIAGSGHVRADRGVPSYVAREAPARTRIAIGFLEVSADAQTVDEYAKHFAQDRFPFDYVGFTVRQEREDPCRGIEKKIRPIRPEPKDAAWVWRFDAAATR